LEDKELSLYLRRVGVKYWDKTIIIGERKMYWRTTEIYFPPNSDGLLGKGDCRRCSSFFHGSFSSTKFDVFGIIH